MKVRTERDYEEALGILREALAFGIEPSLDGIAALARRLGDPQRRYPCIQIAGTNGKSSTARFTAALLRAQGKKVGLYTSPELIEYPERMEIDGAVITHERFAAAVFAARDAAREVREVRDTARDAAREVREVREVAREVREVRDAAREVREVRDAAAPVPATEFELLTAAAFWLFASEHVDFAVLEVGLGGRWDATSIVEPAVAVITGIDLDHTAILGDTIEQIAAEKAAIIKPGCTAVLGPGTEPVRALLLARCEEVGATPMLVGAQEEGAPCLLRLPRYQKQNLACARAAVAAALGHAPEPKLVCQALDGLRIPGRFELIRDSPPLLIDAAHNPQSARALAEALIEHYGCDPASGHLRVFDTLLLGILSDKDATGIIRVLAPLFAQVAVTQSPSPRAIPAAELARLVVETTGGDVAAGGETTGVEVAAGGKTTGVEGVGDGKPESFPSVAHALRTLTARNAATVATGSITLAGEVKRLVLAG